MEPAERITEAELLAVLPKCEKAARYVARAARLSAADADDLVQIALIEVMKGRDRWHPGGSTWTNYALDCARWGARRELARYARQKKRRGIRGVNLGDMEGALVDTRTSDPELAAEAEEALRMVQAILDRHPPGSNFYRIGKLVFFDGIAVYSAARIAGVSKTRAQQIAEKIRDEIRNKTDQHD